jgi:hypothetical protein
MKRIWIKINNELVDVGYSDNIDIKAGIFEYYRDEKGSFLQRVYIGAEALVIGYCSRRYFEAYRERERLMLEGIEMGNKTSDRVLKEAKTNKDILKEYIEKV